MNRAIQTHKQAHGFTLLEVLIAIAIFSVISIISYQGWANIQLQKQRTEQQAGRLDELQRAWYWIAEDFEQATPRSVADTLGSTLPAFEANSHGDSLIEFTRNGWGNPAAELLPPRSSLQRVNYRLQEGKFYRYYSYHLDGDSSEKKRRLLIKDVDAFAMRFLDSSNKWQDTWPPTTASDDGPPPQPKAVELTFELADFDGEIKRLFMLP